MPRGDRTGPAGLGPMTGRAAGYCAGYATPGFAAPGMDRRCGAGFGRGLQMGFRGGRGGRGGRWIAPIEDYGYNAAPTREQEIDALKGRANFLEDALSSIKKRLSDLETDKSGK